MTETSEASTRRRVSARRIACAKCGGRAVPIQWGYPDGDMLSAASRGEIVLGGCVIRGDGTDARWRCGKCGEEWR